MFFLARQSLGIDIRENSLRLAHLAGSGSKVKLLDYLSVPLPSPGGNLAEHETVLINTLNNFISKNQVKAEAIAVSIPQKEAIFRQLKVPALKPEEIRQVLEFEIERHVPFSLDEIYFDFKIIGPKEDGQLELALAAARRERINYLLSLLEKARIAYTRVQLSTFAFFAALTFQENTDKNSNYLLIDVGGHEIELGVVQKGQFVFAHRLGKQTLLNAVAAATAREDSSPGGTGLEEESRKLAQRLKQEINFLVTSLQKTHRETNLTKIFLAGSDFHPLLAEQLQEAAGIQTVAFNPLRGIEISAFTRQPAEAAVAMGLALEGLEASAQGFNLMPPEEQAAQKKGSSMTLPGILAAIAFLLAVGNGASYILKERNQLKRIEERLAQLQPKVRAVEESTHRYEQLLAQKQHLEILGRQPVSLLALLRELTVTLPRDVWLERLKLHGEEVEIGGFAKTASSLIPLLEESRLFKDVKFSSPITSRGGGKERFNIKMLLEEQ